MIYLKFNSVVSKNLSADHKELHWDIETKYIKFANKVSSKIEEINVLVNTKKQQKRYILKRGC